MSEVHKHPKALPICFLTEMWERFGFMLLSTTIVFVLIRRFDLTDERADIIIGSFAAVLYVTAVLAGQIADKLIGYYRSVLLGGIILIGAYCYLAIAPDLLHFCIAMGFICSGTGLLKTNVGSYLGYSYGDRQKQSSSGFTVFYVGINVGSLMGSLSAGYLFSNYGSVGIYLIAAVMLVLSCLAFYIGFKKFKLEVRVSVSLVNWLLSVLITLLGVAATILIIYNPSFSQVFLIIMVVGSIYMCFRGAKNVDDYKKALAYFLFLTIATFFWVLYNQQFMALNLFVDRAVEHKVFGFLSIPTQAFMAFNNVAILAGGVILSLVWKKYNILDTTKYVIGMFILIFMFLAVSLGIYASGVDTENLVNGNWAALSYTIIGVAELLISAIGLSLATRLAPPNQIGCYMGLWFVNTGIAGYIAGVMAKYAAVPKDIHDIMSIKQIYLHSFNMYICLAIVAFVFTIFLSFFIKKLLGDEA